MKYFKFLIIFTLIIACQPTQVDQEPVGPKLLRPKLKAIVGNKPKTIKAYIFLKNARRTIKSIDIEEEKNRMNAPEEVKFLKRYSELKEVYNSAVTSYRQMGNVEGAYDDFQRQKLVFEQKEHYLNKNFGI